MKFLKPSIENLISLARYGGKNRYKAAKEIANLDPDVSIDDLLWLIEELTTDVDDPVFSETGISLGKLIEKMSLPKVEELVEKLLSSHKGRLLLNIMLSSTKTNIDPDMISEIIRRLLRDKSDEVKNGAIGVLRNFLDVIGRDEVTEIVLELANSTDQEIKCFTTIILLALRDVLPVELIQETILMLLDDDDESIRKCAVKALGEGLIETIINQKRMLRTIFNKILSIDESYIQEILEMIKDNEKIYSKILNLIKNLRS